MGLIPWRNKQDLPVRRETAESGLPSVAQLRREMDGLFTNFLRDPWSLLDSWGERSFGAAWLPSVDVSEDEKGVKVALEVPGIDPKDIEISLSGNMLRVEGEKKEEKEDKGKDYYRSERRFGSFSRVVELPPGTDLDSIQADYQNGVLSITAKKEAGSSRKKIPIFNR